MIRVVILSEQKTKNQIQMKKRTSLFLLAMLAVAPCQWLHAQITLNQHNTTVKAVIQRIQKQTKYKFFYDDAIGRTTVANIKVNNASLTTTLDLLLQGKGISYAVEDKIVYLRKKERQTPVRKKQAQKKMLPLRRERSAVPSPMRTENLSLVSQSRCKAPTSWR